MALAFRVCLALGALAALSGPGWLSVAPNRLLPGLAEPGWAVLGWTGAIVAGAALAAAFLVDRGRGGAWVALAGLGGALVTAAVVSGGAAQARLAEAGPIARASLGGGFWLCAAALLLLALEAARATRSGLAGPLWLAGSIGALAAAAWAGSFAHLSLAVEYAARAQRLQAALGEHLVLAGGALALALGVALPLAGAASRFPRIAGPLGAAASAVQVVPAIALFGLLVAGLSLVLARLPALRDLGIGAIGPTPAVLAVGAYLVLPLYRATTSGLASADPAVVESARAMGMTEARLTWEIRLPLGSSILAGGLRVAVVQAIGLTTLGGLVGAGGLGAIVFEGMSQFAEDLIVLAAAPIVGLAILADLVLGGLESRLRKRA